MTCRNIFLINKRRLHNFSSNLPKNRTVTSDKARDETANSLTNEINSEAMMLRL